MARPKSATTEENETLETQESPLVKYAETKEGGSETIMSSSDNVNKDKTDAEKVLDDISKTTPVTASSEKPMDNDTESAKDVLDSIAKTTGSSTVENEPEEEISLNEKIPCVSIAFGGLSWQSPKTNAYYRWNEFGSIVYLSFEELLTMNNSSRDFLFRPLIIVQDPRVVSHFRLLDTYKDVQLIGQLEEIFKKNPKEINGALDKIVKVNMRDVAISKVRQMRRDRALTDIDVIRLIEQKLYFDLSHDSPGR